MYNSFWTFVLLFSRTAYLVYHIWNILSSLFLKFFNFFLKACFSASSDNHFIISQLWHFVKYFFYFFWKSFLTLFSVENCNTNYTRIFPFCQLLFPFFSLFSLLWLIFDIKISNISHNHKIICIYISIGCIHLPTSKLAHYA